MAARVHTLFVSRSGPNPAMQVAIAAAASVVAAYAIIVLDDPILTFVPFVAAAFVAIGLTRPALFLAVLLLARPLVEINGSRLGVLNAAGALGVLTVFVLAVRIVTARQQVRPVGAPAFGVVLLLSAAACVPAYLELSAKVGAKPAGEIVRLAAMFAAYVLAAQLFTSPRRVNQLWALVGLSGFAPAMLGVFELMGHRTRTQGLDISRISGPFTGPNPFGLYLAFTALVLIALPRKALPPWVRVVALTPMLIALVATYSRAGWALFLIGFVLLMWRRSPSLMGFGLVVVLSLVLFVPTIHNRVLPPPNPQDAPLGGGVSTPESYQFRLNNWQGLLGKWEDRPLTGFGLQSTVYVNPKQFRAATTDTSGFDAHNSAIKLLVEGGVVLLFAWIVLIATMTSRFRTLSRLEWTFGPQARALLFVWIGVIVIGLTTDDPLAATALMYGLFALSGSLEGAYLRASRSARAPASPARETALAKQS
ncbi:MAG: O-antigen ligase family protein [Gaiellaceae bacterium]